MLVKIVFVALFASTTLVDGAADVLSSFAQDKIVPNVLETAPTTLLVVRYGDKRQVALGGELRPTMSRTSCRRSSGRPTKMRFTPL